MPWKEKLYERALKRPIDEQTKAIIHSEFRQRRAQIPIPAELSWHAAKLFATDENRCHVVRYIESVADDLNL